MDIVASEYYLLLALVPLAYLSIRLVRGAFGAPSHGLRLPPGPWQLPVIGSLHHVLGALPHRALRDLARRHGPLMLLKYGEVPVIIASTAEAAKEIMKTHDHAFCTRPLSSAVKVLNERCLGIAFAPYGDRWRQLRKICNLELLSAKRISSFRPVREEEVIRFIRSISSASEMGTLVNLSKKISMYVTDTTVHTILGGRFKEHDTLQGYVDGALQLLGGFSLQDLFPSSRLARIMSSNRRRAEVYGDSLMAFMEGVMEEHLKKRSSDQEVELQEDLVDVLLRIQRESSHDLQFPPTMNNIKAVIFDLIAGGTESPATTLQWAMAELMQNPSVMSRAQDEVRRAFMGQMKVTEEDLHKLSYMRCIIKETLRLHVPGPFLLPRKCREPCNVLGYDVPRGITVLVNAWAISRDPEYWDEPESFLPDRFVDKATDFSGTNFEVVPFGAGRRICPGIQFAVANIELALASLLFYFDWALPDGVLPGHLDMEETMGITARKKTPLWLRATVHLPLPC